MKTVVNISTGVSRSSASVMTLASSPSRPMLRTVPHTVAPEIIRWQNAWGVAMAAAGKTPCGAEELLPSYLRLSQAERERQEKMSQ